MDEVRQVLVGTVIAANWITFIGQINRMCRVAEISRIHNRDKPENLQNTSFHAKPA